jgi:hypothetical protein
MQWQTELLTAKRDAKHNRQMKFRCADTSHSPGTGRRAIGQEQRAEEPLAEIQRLGFREEREGRMGVAGRGG